MVATLIRDVRLPMFFFFFPEEKLIIYWSEVTKSNPTVLQQIQWHHPILNCCLMKQIASKRIQWSHHILNCCLKNQNHIISCGSLSLCISLKMKVLALSLGSIWKSGRSLLFIFNTHQSNVKNATKTTLLCHVFMLKCGSATRILILNGIWLVSFQSHWFEFWVAFYHWCITTI